MNNVVAYVQKISPWRKMLAIFILTVVAPPLITVASGCYHYSPGNNDMVFGKINWSWSCGSDIGIFTHAIPVVGSLWVMIMNRRTRTDSWVWYVLPIPPLAWFGLMTLLGVMFYNFHLF